MSEVAGRVIVRFFVQAEDGIRDYDVTGVQTCALPICQMALSPLIVDKSAKMRLFPPEVGLLSRQKRTFRSWEWDIRKEGPKMGGENFFFRKKIENFFRFFFLRKKF